MAPFFQFLSEEILSTNIERSVSIGLFLVTERYTGFDAAFFEDDIYVIYIFFIFLGFVQISRMPSFFAS